MALRPQVVFAYGGAVCPAGYILALAGETAAQGGSRAGEGECTLCQVLFACKAAVSIARSPAQKFIVCMARHRPTPSTRLLATPTILLSASTALPMHRVLVVLLFPSAWGCGWSLAVRTVSLAVQRATPSSTLLAVSSPSTCNGS